jgi:two-component system cell cycle sensor histidine kinase/response regulator CckA
MRHARSRHVATRRSSWWRTRRRSASRSTEILRKAGYEVLVVDSPERSDLALRANRETPIHLLLTDVVMPGMNGRELSDVFVTRCPDAKVLFMSGYTDDVMLHHGVLEAGVPFLQKPVTPMGLSRKVREVLDAPRRL